MYKYNDYLQIARTYLRNYVKHQQAIKTLSDDIKQARNELFHYAGKVTVSYGEQVGKGHQELNSIEQKTDKNMELRIYIAELHTCRKNIEDHLERMDIAIRKLTDEEREITEIFFFEGKGYDTIEDALHLSKASCQRRISKITRKVAESLFGSLAKKDIQFVHG